MEIRVGKTSGQRLYQVRKMYDWWNWLLTKIELVVVS